MTVLLVLATFAIFILFDYYRSRKLEVRVAVEPRNPAGEALETCGVDDKGGAALIIGGLEGARNRRSDEHDGESAPHRAADDIVNRRLKPV